MKLKNEEALRVNAMFKAGYTINDVMDETDLPYKEIKRLKEEGDFEYQELLTRIDELEGKVAESSVNGEAAERVGKANRRRDRDQIDALTEERNGYKGKIDRFQDKGCAAPMCPKSGCEGHLSDLFITPQGKVVLACDKCMYRDFKGKALSNRCNRTYYKKLIEDYNDELIESGAQDTF